MLTLEAALTSSLGLSGAPFAAAYFSKEPIIEMMMVDSFSFMEFWVMIFSVVLTLAYSFRFIYMVMMKWSSQETSNVYYENFWVNLATGILFVPSFSSGALLNSTMVVYPTFFMNSNYLKMIILLIPLVTIFFSLLGKSYLISYEYSLWAMFSMTLFSGKLWKPVVFTMGKWVSVANKSFVLKFLTFMKSSQLNLTTAYNSGMSMLYRLISSL